MHAHLFAITALATCLAAPLYAVDYQCHQPEGGSLFNLSACANQGRVDSRLAFIAADTAEEMINQLDADALRKYFGASYNEAVDATAFDLDFRGVLMQLSSAAGSSTVNFAIDKLGIKQAFTGITRDDSMNKLEDYIKKEGDKILAELIRVSAVEPIAGNPSSLQAQMVDAAFSDAVLDDTAISSTSNQLGLSMRFGRYTLAKQDLTMFSLPLSYSKTLDNGDSLKFRLPLSYSSVDGAKSYRVALGMSYKHNVNERWALTPGVDYGLVGSPDLGSVGQIASASLTSDLSLYSSAKLRVGMGNMIGYYRVLPLSFDDYNLSADISNIMYRNGLLVSVPLQAQVFGQYTSLDVYLVDTRFTGDDLYTDNYQELGVVFGPRKQYQQLSANTSSQVFGIGLKYLYAGGDNDINGVEITFNYRF